MNIKPLLKGASLSRKSARQPYHVSGISGTTPSVMWAALYAGGLPQPEQLHPATPTLKVIDAEVTEMLGNFDCVVTVTYGPSDVPPGGGGNNDQGTLEIDSSIVVVKTMIDINGDPITVIYNPGDAAARDVAASVNEAQGDRSYTATVDQFVPMITARVTRVENIAPLAKAKKFVGMVNNANLFDGSDEQAWLCTRIAGTRNLNTVDKYNVTYELQSPEDGWIKVAGYIDPTTGEIANKNIGRVVIAVPRPRPTITMDKNIAQDRSRNGITLVRVQALADFSELNFPTL